MSTAPGAIGSLVGRLAKSGGCRVIGIARSAGKCALVRDETGFDDCINYKTSDLCEELDRCCPVGIDIYFDNIGGDALAANMAQRAAGNLRPTSWRGSCAEKPSAS
ncbi:MAG: zinc-binding dehydrogenase [Rhodanobacter sp.]